MTPPRSNQSPRHPRGRPKGTTKFEHQDLRLLAQFAEQVLDLPQSKLARFLAKRGYEQKDIRRAQKRWREHKAALLKEARLRADAAPPQNLVEFMLYVAEAVSAIAGAARPAIEKFSKSLGRAERRVAARRELGLDLGLPLDLADEDTVEQAIQRYEATVAKGHVPAAFKGQTLADLPFSLKLYVVAMQLHELSLQAAEAEKREAE